jgi:hypothetical protein
MTIGELRDELDIPIDGRTRSLLVAGLDASRATDNRRWARPAILPFMDEKLTVATEGLLQASLERLFPTLRDLSHASLNLITADKCRECRCAVRKARAD